jgi:hypothetical protein
MSGVPCSPHQAGMLDARNANYADMHGSELNAKDEKSGKIYRRLIITIIHFVAEELDKHQVLMKSRHLNSRTKGY